MQAQFFHCSCFLLVWPPASQPASQPSQAGGADSAQADAHKLAAFLAQADPGALQTIALYENGCFPFIGNSAGLRSAAAAQPLTPAPPSMADTVLRGRPGVVYNASTSTGKRLLISFDGGMCAVSTYTDDSLLIKSLILLNADASDAVVLNHFTKAAPNGKILFQFDALQLQGTYPIIGFVDFTSADELTAPHQLDITAGNVNLHP